VGAGRRGGGLAAAPHRQPPAKLTNRLYIADGTGNRIAYLEFAR
jgi:hypothetical protein